MNRLHRIATASLSDKLHLKYMYNKQLLDEGEQNIAIYQITADILDKRGLVYTIPDRALAEHCLQQNN